VLKLALTCGFFAVEQRPTCSSTALRVCHRAVGRGVYAGAVSTVVSFRVDDETLALVDQLCEQRRNTRGQLFAHALDRVLAGHGLLDPSLIAQRRVARGDDPAADTR
jgi:hypothetical protein